MESREEARPEHEVAPKENGAAPEDSILRRAMTSQSFIEKTTLLLLTALLSGLIIPVILDSLQAKRTRDEAIRRAQSQLLDEISTTILTYETLAADVSWYKDEHVRDDARHEKAYQRYNDRAAELVSQRRALAAKAQTLASEDVSERLFDFLQKAFRKQDTPMLLLYRDQADDSEWQEQHDINVAMIEEAKGLIKELAIIMDISNQP